MLMEISQNPLYVAGGAFLLGWLIAKFGAYLARRKPKDRDPRDDRIRSLEAEFRVARSGAENANEALDKQKKLLVEAEEIISLRDMTISEQLELLEQMRIDLKESVLKTRELRAELSERATANAKSEVMLREVQTELSVAKASNDLITTGLLDYSSDEGGIVDDMAGPKMAKAASGD